MLFFFQKSDSLRPGLASNTVFWRRCWNRPFPWFHGLSKDEHTPSLQNLQNVCFVEAKRLFFCFVLKDIIKLSSKSEPECEPFAGITHWREPPDPLTGHSDWSSPQIPARTLPSVSPLRMNFPMFPSSQNLFSAGCTSYTSHRGTGQTRILRTKTTRLHSMQRRAHQWYSQRHNLSMHTVWHALPLSDTICLLLSYIFSHGSCLKTPWNRILSFEICFRVLPTRLMFQINMFPIISHWAL